MAGIGDVEGPYDYSFSVTGKGSNSSTSSTGKPMSSQDIGSLVKNIAADNAYGGKINYRNIEKVDQELVGQIQSCYANALDSIGLNFKDGLEAYSTRFNKNAQTLGLDPQKPGKSYVFFTRPDLNLVTSNVNRVPFMSWAMKSEIGKLVGNYLQYPNTPETQGVVGLDAKFKTISPFDPFKTNTCKELSGLKDMVMDKYETEGDYAGHQLTYASGSDGFDSIGEVTVTFEDSIGSPSFLREYLHFMYIHEACKGTISPRLYYIANRRLDYTFSIYTFKLAEDNETILRFSKLTGCFPINVSMNTLNHSRDSKIDEFDEISVTYAYNAYEPMNPRVLADFNALAMRTAITGYHHLEGGMKDINISKLRPYDPVEQLIVNSYTGDKIWSLTPIVYGNKLLFI